MSIPRSQTIVTGFVSSPWDWSAQYNDAQVALNYDPVYVFREEHEPAGFDADEYRCLKLDLTVLTVRLWSLCYLRWIVPVTIVGGGRPAEYLTQCRLVEELHSLRLRVLDLESRAGMTSPLDRPRSMLVFGGPGSGRTIGPDDSSIMETSVYGTSGAVWNSALSELLPPVSSSFPFVDCCQHFVNTRNLAAPTVDLYSDRSSFCWEDEDYGDEFEDEEDESISVPVAMVESSVFVQDSAAPVSTGDQCDAAILPGEPSTTTGKRAPLASVDSLESPTTGTEFHMASSDM